MRDIKRILVTGDFMRQRISGGSSQNGNIRWLFHLARPALELLTSLAVSPVLFNGGSGCIGGRLYGVNQLREDFESWVKIYNKNPQPRDLAIIDEEFEGSLVLSFELPELVRKSFDQLDIPYVDFTIHPARFMDDLIFGVRSNIPGLAHVLQPWIIFDEEICISAGLAMATLSRLPRLKECAGADDVALFAGQTTDDKVLIKNDRLMQVDDYMDGLAELAARHSKVLVKPHPYAKQNKMVLALTRLFPNTEMVDANFYHLLSHENISHVYSLTSSTSIEAAYFGKKGIHLAPYPYFFSDQDANGGGYLTIRPEIFTPKFWEPVLTKAGVTTNVVRDVTFPSERSRMRKSLRNFWGADVFEFAG